MRSDASGTIAASHSNGAVQSIGVVLAVAAVDRVQHQHAIFHRSAHRPNLVHRPRQRHRAVAADAPVGRAQAGDAVGDRRRNDRAERFGADREADQAGRRRRPGTRRRSAGAALDVPGVVRRAAEPHAALRERAHRQLRDQHRAGIAQPLDDGRVEIDHLILVRRGAPGGLDALGGQQILRAPRNAVQRSAILAGLDLGVGRRRLLERELLGQRDHALQRVAVLLQTIEIDLRQLG